LTGTLRHFVRRRTRDVVAECQANLDEKQAQADLASKRLADLS
jgi:valyl-tRNA synthetase